MLLGEASWAEVQTLNQNLEVALAALAAELRALGRYDQVRAAGKSTSNPLSPTVINALCPDLNPECEGAACYSSIDRLVTLSHSAVMLKVKRGEDGVPDQGRQNHFFVCPSDADWERIAALHEAAKGAATALEDYFSGVGTYDRAAERYKTPLFNADDQVEIITVDRLQPEIAQGRVGTVGAVEPQGVEVVIEGFNPILFQPGQVRAYEAPPVRPEFNEGDLVRGYRANSK